MCPPLKIIIQRRLRRRAEGESSGFVVAPTASGACFFIQFLRSHWAGDSSLHLGKQRGAGASDESTVTGLRRHLSPAPPGFPWALPPQSRGVRAPWSALPALRPRRPERTTQRSPAAAALACVSYRGLGSPHVPPGCGRRVHCWFLSGLGDPHARRGQRCGMRHISAADLPGNAGRRSPGGGN